MSDGWENISYPSRIKQVVSFDGLERHRKIRPTDIDGLIDYGGVSFLYFDAKVEGTEIMPGQKMALENLVKSHNSANHESCAMIICHNTPIGKLIIAKDCIVDAVYLKMEYGFDWIRPKEQITLLQAIETWEKKMKNKNIRL